MIRKVLCLCLVIISMASCVYSAEAERDPLPELLLFRQRTETQNQSQSKLQITRSYPETANKTVNRAVAKMVDRLSEAAESKLPGKAAKSAQADTGVTVRVTGTRTASFFVLAHVAVDQEPRWADFETAVYDLAAGRELALDDLFDASADEIIENAVREQLTAYFPDMPAGQKALDRLCAEIRTAPFTLSPAYLQFHYHASELYRGKVTLMHVRIPYRLLTESMTDYAKQELDNSNYLLAALTFDDGPGRGVTANILRILREWCAVGTFFNLGRPMRTSHDYIAWEHNAGHAVQSHTYSHTDRLSDKTVMFEEKERFAREQTEIIGIPPAYMRAPGGNDKLYAKYGIGMPIVHWTTLTGDASGKNKANFANTMVHTLKETSVILMHNTGHHSVQAADSIADRLYKRGYMFVTVDELFEIRGMPMQDNVIYYGDEADQQE